MQAIFLKSMKNSAFFLHREGKKPHIILKFKQEQGHVQSGLVFKDWRKNISAHIYSCNACMPLHIGRWERVFFPN